MIERAIFVLVSVVLAIVVGWLVVTHNYGAMIVIAGVCLVLLLVACAFAYVIQSRQPGLIGEAIQRRSARILAKHVIEQARKR